MACHQLAAMTEGCQHKTRMLMHPHRSPALRRRAHLNQRLLPVSTGMPPSGCQRRA